MSDIYKATKNKVVDTAFEKPDVYKATANKQIDQKTFVKNKMQNSVVESVPFPSGTLTPSKTNTQIQQKLGSGINKPPIHPILNDDYKQFRYDSLKLDTLGADISKAGDAVKTAYSGWQDKKSMESLKPTIENAYNRLKMLDSYNTDYGDGSVDVSEQLKVYESILDEWDEIAETYGKYDSADKYNKAQAESNAYIEKMKKMESVNLETLGAEVEAWEKERDKIIDNKEWLNKGDWRNDENGTPAIPYSATSIPAFVGKNIMEMQEMVAKKKELYNLAKRYQDLQKLSSVLDKTSENYDKNAEKYIKKGKETDFHKVGNDYSTDYVNEEGVNTGTTYIIDDLRAAAIALAEHNGTPKTETNGDNYRNVKKYRHLKENEFEAFAYYLGKDMETGGNQAGEYLDMMDETLKTRMGTETYEKYLKDNSLLETLYAVPVGLNQFASGVTNLFNTKDDYIPVSPTQVAGQLAREDLSDAGFKLPKWLGGSSFGQGVYDVLSTTANMAPSILASAVANYVVPGSGAYVGGALMGASAKGNAYQEALNNGMDKSQARTYSTLVGVSEAALSALLSKAMGGKALEGKVKDVIDGIDNKFLKFAANYGVAFTSEGLEEGLQEVLTPFFENFALGYGKNGFDDIDWGEVAYSYLLGGLSGGMFEAGPTAVKGAVNYLKNVNYVKKTYGAGATIDNLINLGLSLPTETKAYKYAKQINDNVNSGKKVSSNKLYNLVLATENIVADRLNQLGETNNLLQTADAVVKKLSGLELTVPEIETLSKSSYGQEVLENMTPKAESAETTLQDTESGVVGENVSAVESGVPSAAAESGSGNVGFTEPTDQEIYRDPTPQENEEAMFGTRKNAKQRHILDVAKKLDSNMKVVFVNKSSKTLNDKNGKYNRNTNTMYIAKDLSAVEMYAEVFKHEFIHRLETRKAYQSFKNYLFKKSEAFEAYANARLYYPNKLDIERTRDEAINGLVDMYVENTKGDLNLTREQAEREAVADFVARTLFKDKNKDFRQAIEDKNLFNEKGTGFAQMESNLALFEEMAKTDRNLFQKIIDAIRDLIASIKGMPNLEKDLKYLEERLARVYESADVTNNIDSGEVYKNSSYNIIQDLSVEGLEYDADSESLYSADSWESSEYVKDRKGTAKKISEAIGVSERKALQYIKDIDSIANKVLSNYARLGYVPSPDRSAFVSNAEYGGSIDMSTLCAKRRWLTGTFSAIQKALNHTALTANEILEIRNMLKEKGIEVSCGLCYVEGSRAQMGKFAKEFIERYKKRDPDWVPDMSDVNTPEGVEQMRMEHPEAYEAYEKFWNNKGVLNEGEKVLFASQQKPKLYQLRTDYKHEILDKFSSEGNVVEKNKNGGLRIQSFSDFEIVHLIDMMQVIIDMSRVGLNGQAYTKVPEFALALGNTGLKINLSLIAKDVDAEGNLVFDDVEGMPFETAMNIRNMYSKNVGTVLVVFNDAQLMAALKDSRIDFVLPFHRSQWKKAMYEQLGLPTNTKDYTYIQNEKYIKPVYYTTRKGTIGKRKATNYMPNQYWDFNISGKENAEKYLKMCAEENKRPKFYKFLDDNGDGSYSLKKDGSTDGYWKLLIDFKMYDNDGKGSKQTAVKPDFNMEECHKMLDTYEGGHEKFPVNQEVVDSFVSNYMKKHGEQRFKEEVKSNAKTPTTKYDVSFSSDDLNYFSGSKGSENLYNTPESLKPDSEREWSIFNRHFSNKTNDLKNGENSNIIIYTADYVYLVAADGYMSGKIVNKLLIDGNEEIINDTIKEFENGTFKPTARINSVIQSIRNEQGRSRLGNALSSGNITTKVDGFLDREEYNSDTGRSASKSNVDKIKSEETYSSDDLSTLQRNLYNRHKNGELTNEEYLEETDKLWGKANETYGMLPQGENAKAPIATPAAVAEDKPTERFTRTLIETGKLTDEMLQGVEEKVLLGDFSYKVISDEKALQKADSAVKNGTAEDVWESAVNDGRRLNKNQIAIGERLLKDAIESGNTKRVLELSAELADIFTRAGQVVQSARLLKKMTGAGRLVSLQRTVKTINKDLRTKYGEDYPPIKISEESAKRLAEAKTAGGVEHAYQEIMQEVAAQVPVTFMDKWNAWRYFAMLSNPKTHIRNFIGNGFFLPIVIFKDAIGTGLEAVTIRDNAQKTKAFIVKKEYYRYAYNDGKLKSVKNLLKGNKYNDKTAIREKQRIFKNEALEFLTNFNSNALEAEDMLFKNIHYIHALAGYLQARNVDLNNVSQEVLDDARTYAVEEAKKATFNDESALANAIQRFGNKNLATNMLVEGVLPFKRTPINIVKRGIEYSPIGLIKTATKGLYDVKKGKITLSECIDGFASGLTGTGLLALGWVLASMGAVSGGEKDDDESQFEKLLGKQEYAIEIGDKSYTVDWAAPANIPFFIGVEIANISREDEDFTFANVFNTMWNALEPITNLSMLSGIQSVIESARYAEPSQVISSIAVDALTSYSMQGLPSLLGATARTIDSKQRSWYIDKNDKWLDSTAQTIKNNIQSKVPGLTKTQIPKIDMWGREVSRGKVGERILENFISPGYYSAIEYNETSEELKRIFKETDVDVFPNLAEKSFAVDKKTKYLTADEYVTYAKAKGNYSFDYLREFMEHSSYERLTDAEKADVITDLYKYANAKAKTTVSDYDLMKNFKTVTNWERNGRSAVDYYIYQAINK